MREMIDQLLRAEPFQPFRLYLTGGTVYEVRHPENVQVSASTIRLGTWQDGRPPTFHLRAMLSLRHVVRLEPMLADEPTVVEEKDI